MKYILAFSLLLFAFVANSQTVAPKKIVQPEFDVTFFGKPGGNISLNEARAGGGITVRLAGESQSLEVLSFEMSISQGSESGEASAFGSSLNSDQRSLLFKLKKGSKLFFSLIKVKMPNGSTKIIKKGISFKIY